MMLQLARVGESPASLCDLKAYAKLFLVVIRVGEHTQDVYDARWIIDHNEQSVLVPGHVEHGNGAATLNCHSVGVWKCPPDVM